jgi:hypothetical protein
VFADRVGSSLFGSSLCRLGCGRRMLLQIWYVCSALGRQAPPSESPNIMLDVSALVICWFLEGVLIMVCIVKFLSNSRL